MSETMSPHQAKKKAKERDGQQCVFCGVSNEQHKSEHGRGVEAHHVIKDLDGGKDHPKNLITVCRECHNILERTHAEALSRIKEEHVSEIESELEHAQEDYQKAYDHIDRLESDIEQILEGIEDFFDASGKFDVYVVHETKTVTSELRYVGTDSTKAYEKFEDCDNHATIETASVWADLVDALSGTKVENIESDILYDRIKDIEAES